jgi:hypothetical protein
MLYTGLLLMLKHHPSLAVDQSMPPPKGQTQKPERREGRPTPKECTELEESIFISCLSSLGLLSGHELESSDVL